MCMKSRTNITIHSDVLERAQDQDINVSHIAEQALRRVIGMGLKKKDENKYETGDLLCSHCQKWIHENVYFCCVYHGTFFCDGCAHISGDMSYESAPKCKRLYRIKRGNFEREIDKIEWVGIKDCIWERREIINEQSDNT